MEKKYKILIIIVVFIMFVFTSGITYSFFHSTTTINTNQNIAKFIFNTESLDALNIALSDLKPGDNKEYTFDISNQNNEVTSDVIINYEMSIKTYHFIPLIIKLYKIEDSIETLVMNCDESYSRDSENKLVCNTDTIELSHTDSKIDTYKLKIEFPSEYNTTEYTSLVDFIDIEIKSWQKIGE